MWQEEMKWIFNPFWLAPEWMRWDYPTYLGLSALFHIESINLLTVWSMTWWLNILLNNYFWNLDQNKKRVKQSRVEELGSRQSGCARQKVLVRQRGGLMHLLAWWDMMMMMMMMMMTKQAWSIIIIIMHNDTIMSLVFDLQLVQFCTLLV